MKNVTDNKKEYHLIFFICNAVLSLIGKLETYLRCTNSLRTASLVGFCISIGKTLHIGLKIKYILAGRSFCAIHCRRPEEDTRAIYFFLWKFPLLLRWFTIAVLLYHVFFFSEVKFMVNDYITICYQR